MAGKNKILRALAATAAGCLAFAVGSNCAGAAQAGKRETSAAHRAQKPVSRKPAPPRNTYRWQVLRAHPLRMFYYFDDTRGFESLRAHGEGMTVLAPQCYSVDGEGNVRGTIPARVLAEAKEAKLPIMPLIFNQGFERSAASALLRSRAAQERAIRTMVNLANRDDDVGFQIDLENVAPADHYLLTLFVRRAAAEMHREGRLLSVAVTAQFSDARALPQRRGKKVRYIWPSAYDYRSLGASADLITLMAYDHSSRNGPPGPIAGYAWVKTAVEYAVRRVPRSKLLLGIPLYGREWIAGGDSSSSRSLDYGDIRGLIERPEIHVQWDERWRSPWFEYNDGAAQRTVWYEDSRSLHEKLSLMQDYRLRGFAAWRLGDEGPDLWPMVTDLARPPDRAPSRKRRTTVAAKRKAKPESRPDGSTGSGAGTGKE